MQTQEQPAVLSSQPSNATNSCSSSNYFQKAKDYLFGAQQEGNGVLSNLAGLFKGGNDPRRAQQRMRMQMRMMRGGTAKPYQNLTNLASHGAPIYGIQSAAPHQLTRGGGRYRRKKCNNRKKTRRCSRKRRGSRFTKRMSRY